jgi:hypothetical protein
MRDIYPVNFPYKEILQRLGLLGRKQERQEMMSGKRTRDYADFLLGFREGNAGEQSSILFIASRS